MTQNKRATETYDVKLVKFYEFNKLVSIFTIISYFKDSFNIHLHETILNIGE